MNTKAIFLALVLMTVTASAQSAHVNGTVMIPVTFRGIWIDNNKSDIPFPFPMEVTASAIIFGPPGVFTDTQPVLSVDAMNEDGSVIRVAYRTMTGSLVSMIWRTGTAYGHNVLIQVTADAPENIFIYERKTQ